MSAQETNDSAAEQSLTPEQLRVQLEGLKAAATQEYSLKNYPAAAEHYSEAAEVQDQINGEMSPENADLLYQYGRCLYHVAVSNSDVLGGKVASAEEPKRKKRKVATESSAAGASHGGDLIGDALKDGEEQLAGEVVEAAVEEKQATKPHDDQIASKPFFQITGDENFTDSEDEDEADAQAEEEEDDFAIAYEILDVARVLLGKKLAALEETAGKATKERPEIRQIKERLADTHDLQAEISLENERFHDAINDTRDALALKLQLYPQENSLIAEAHFKLSLALEFASVTQSQEEGADPDEEKKVAQIDEDMRKDAAVEMEKAIESCKLRIAKEKAELSSLEASKAEERKKTIVDVQEMVADMEQRLVDLNLPAVSLAAGPAGAPDGSDPLRGVLGAMLGESKTEQQKRVAEATATANDLTGLVKHKKKPKAENTNLEVVEEDGKGKRKSEDPLQEEPNGKKAKVEDA